MLLPGIIRTGMLCKACSSGQTTLWVSETKGMSVQKSDIASRSNPYLIVTSIQQSLYLIVRVVPLVLGT